MSSTPREDSTAALPSAMATPPPPAAPPPPTPSSRLPLRSNTTPTTAPASRPKWRSRIAGRLRKDKSDPKMVDSPSDDSLTRTPLLGVRIASPRSQDIDSHTHQSPTTPTPQSNVMVDKPLPPMPDEEVTARVEASPTTDRLRFYPSEESFINRTPAPWPTEPTKFLGPDGVYEIIPPPRPSSTLSMMQSPFNGQWNRPMETVLPAPAAIQSPTWTYPNYASPPVPPLMGDASSPALAPVEKGDDSPKAKRAVTPATLIAAGAAMTQVINGGPPPKVSMAIPHSEGPEAAASAVEAEPTVKFQVPSLGLAATPEAARKLSTPDGPRSEISIWKRDETVHGLPPKGTHIPQPTGSSHRRSLRSPNFFRDGAIASTGTESRPHSPSPRSFSCPRPGSVSTKNSADNLSGVQTASRLPIAEGKRPIVVDVKPRNSQGSVKSDQQPPTFGSRRLDKKTVDILDHGIKRRQRHMQRGRMGSDNSVGKTALAHASNEKTKVATPDAMPVSGDRDSGAWNSAGSDICPGMKSDDHLTYATSLSDGESEVTTPIDRPMLYRNPLNGSDEVQDAFSDPLDAGYSHPPPTSNYAAPLPTIYSQPALPIRRSQNEENITEALSRLEGKGDPPVSDVDEKTVHEEFGHVAEAFKGKTATTTATTPEFFEAAQTAKKYLALADEEVQKAENVFHASAPTTVTARQDTVQGSSAKLEPAVSKWSNTTHSEGTEKEDRAKSEQGEVGDTNRTDEQQIPQQPARPPPPPPPLPRMPARSRESIGYPSRVAANTEALTLSSQNAAADIPDIARRQSSPTLGPRPQRSLRRVRQSIKPGPASYAQPTQAAKARMNSRIPTTTARDGVNGEQRGRRLAGPKQSRVASVERVKNPRARSKSRYVMDKINGLFTGKHNRKSDAIPPIPRIPNEVNPSDGLVRQAAEQGEQTNVDEVSSTSPPPNVRANTSLAAGPQTQPSTGTMRTGESTLIDAAAPSTPRPNNTANAPSTRALPVATLEAFAERLRASALRETNLEVRLKGLRFAHAIRETTIHSREAQIAAERAEEAARRAAMANAIVQSSLEALAAIAAQNGEDGLALPV